MDIKTIRLGTVNSEKHKVLAFVLSKVKGLGINSAQYLCYVLKINPFLKLSELSEELIADINVVLDSKVLTTNNIYTNNEDKSRLLFDSELKIYSKRRIALLKKLKTYVGIRHTKNQKVHGQKTRSSGRTNKKTKVPKRNVKT